MRTARSTYSSEPASALRRSGHGVLSLTLRWRGNWWRLPQPAVPHASPSSSGLPTL